MKRRDVLSGGVGAALTALSAPGLARAGRREAPAQRGAFGLRYAPHFGMFAHHAPGGLLDELRFAAEQGFRTWEDNVLARRPLPEQEKITRHLRQLGMQMGTFLAHVERERPSFNSNRPDARERLERDIGQAIDVARRTGARFCTVIPGGRDPDVDRATQIRWCITNLRRAADRCRRHDLVMLLEPLPEPNLFLRTNTDAVHLCRAVGSPACKVLLDIYPGRASIRHAEVLLTGAWNEVGYLQITEGAHPAPQRGAWWTLGALVQGLRRRGFDGPVGLDHGNPAPGLDGERALLAGYRDLDGGGPWPPSMV
jgi:hydroxypyruvate isomerase